MKIEKGIPVSRACGQGKWMLLLEAMSPKDSVLVKNRNEARSFAMACKRRGRKHITRAVKDGVRCWLL